MDKMMTVKETAELWGVPEKQVTRYCRDGRVDGAAACVGPHCFEVESGAGFPDVSILEPLADTLGLPVQCLISGEGEVLGGWIIFGILRYSGAFLKEVRCEVSAVIYENGEAVGETVVTMDGDVTVLGKRTFQGKFAIEGVEKSCESEVKSLIQWDKDEKFRGYQLIEYWDVGQGLDFVDVGVKQYLYISPDMQRFALELEDGRIIATDEALAKLKAIKEYHYALSYEGYPILGRRQED